MSDQLLVVLVVAAVALAGLVSWVVVTIANRPRSPEHDLRRRALAILAGSGALAGPGVSLLSPRVAIALVIVYALVIPAGLYIVLRSPSPPRV
jgi:hypothetical protein